jgi:hypothetical protein
MSLFTAYLIGILPNIQLFFVFVTSVSFSLALVCAIAADMEYSEDKVAAKKLLPKQVAVRWPNFRSLMYPFPLQRRHADHRRCLCWR